MFISSKQTELILLKVEGVRKIEELNNQNIGVFEINEVKTFAQLYLSENVNKNINEEFDDENQLNRFEDIQTDKRKKDFKMKRKITFKIVKRQLV